MSPSSLLLRLLLCLVLVSNGISTALASVHMPAGHATPMAGHGTPASAEASVPCHDGGDNGVHADAAAQDSQGVADASKPSPPECCDSKTCQCTCVQSAQANLVAWAIATGVPERSRHLRPFASAHAEPALPHLIRPPIG